MRSILLTFLQFLAGQRKLFCANMKMQILPMNCNTVDSLVFGMPRNYLVLQFMVILFWNKFGVTLKVKLFAVI